MGLAPCGQSLQAVCPSQAPGLSVGLEGHLHRKMVTDGQGLEGEGAKPETLLSSQSHKHHPGKLPPTQEGAHWVSKQTAASGEVLASTPAVACGWAGSTVSGPHSRDERASYTATAGLFHSARPEPLRAFSRNASARQVPGALRLGSRSSTCLSLVQAEFLLEVVHGG